MTNLRFNEMNLSNSMLKAIEDLGYEEATPIQSRSIELILEGNDVLGQSQTGTGKTAAFGIPAIEKLNFHDRRLQCLILCPTRELAMQVCEEFRKLLKYKDEIRAIPIYGGQPIDRQIIALKRGVQIVIGTPGRVMDHMRRHTLKMENLKMIVLDEADEMLDMGFREDIETILRKTPIDRQTIMFSATMPRAILELSKNYLSDPVHVSVMPKETMTLPAIHQEYYEVREKDKIEALCRIIDINGSELSLVFCNTKKRVDEVVEQLQERGYFAESLHGDLKQIQRDTVMKKFRNRTLEILVATDVAARGIDVDDIDIVFNFDLPQDDEYYVHRIGRTGRAGRSGKAYTFVAGKEIYRLRDIVRQTGSKAKRGKLPTMVDIEDIKRKSFVAGILKTIQDNELDRYVDIVEGIISDHDVTSMDVAAALLKTSLYDTIKNTVEDFDADYSYEKEKRPEPFGIRKKDKNISRLFINIGKKQKVRIKDIVGAMANEGGIPGREIGGIDIYDEFTFVDIPERYAKMVIKKMKNTKIHGIKINVELSKKSK